MNLTIDMFRTGLIRISSQDLDLYTGGMQGSLHLFEVDILGFLTFCRNDYKATGFDTFRALKALTLFS